MPKSNLTLESYDLMVKQEGSPLDAYSIILDLPINYSESDLQVILEQEGLTTQDYQLVPLENWKAYEMVFQLVVRDLRERDAKGIVLNHDTGELLYRIGKTPSHTCIRLLQLVKPLEAPVSSWERLIEDED